MDASSPHQRENGPCQGPVPGVNTCSEVFKGKLQLATHLAVFAGFTGALAAGLWICQRNLIQNGEPELRRSADSIQQCQLKGEDNPNVVQQELLLHSSTRTSLWIEQPDESLLLPKSDHLSISDQTIQAAMAANQK